MPMKPPTSARCSTGTRSGSAEVRLASMPFNPACTSDQPMIMSATFGAIASTSRPTAPSTEPASVHGCRRPKREQVRSDSAPISGFAISATSAPTPMTMLNSASLSALASSWACSGSSTWIGA